MAHFVGIASEFTMIITLSTTGGDYLVDADAAPTAQVKDSLGNVVATPVPVLHPSLGTYTVSWTPTGAGDFTLEWAYLYSGSPYSSVESFAVFPVSVSPPIPIGAPGYVAEVQVVDKDGLPVENMGVQVYDQAGTELLATGYTDAAGEVDFTLPVARYQLRFYGDHILASVPSPRQINVRVPPPSNLWQFVAETFTAPVSPNPSLCRCWGFFVDPAGRAVSGLYLRLTPQRNPVALYPGAVGYSQAPVELVTDKNGYFEVDLPRGGIFSVTAAGYLDSSVDIEIPSQAQANTVNLLFPAPDTVTYAPAGPLALAVGGEVLVAPTLVMSDGRIILPSSNPASTTFVEFTSSDTDVIEVESSGDNLRVIGVGVGSATIVATPILRAFMPRVPAVVLTVTPVTVSVA